MIFVTGGTGFLGRHLVPQLCKAGHHLRVLTRTPHRHPWLQHYPNLEVVTGDIATNEGLNAVADCDAIIHAAGLFSMWGGAGNFEETNAIGTHHLLEAATRHRVQRFIHVSTLAVIGNPQAGRIIDETHPPRPADRYQASKLQAEHYVQQTNQYHALQTVILRPGAFYGPLGEYAFNRLFFTDPMRGLIVEPDGGHYLTFPVYIADVVQGIILALEKGQSGEIYNICGDSITHKTVYDIVCQEADLHLPRIHLPNVLGIAGAGLLTVLAKLTNREPFYPLGLRSYVFNDWCVTSAKAQAELGFVPTPFRDGARRTIAWYRAGKPDHLPEHTCT